MNGKASSPWPETSHKSRSYMGWPPKNERAAPPAGNIRRKVGIRMNIQMKKRKGRILSASLAAMMAASVLSACSGTQTTAGGSATTTKAASAATDTATGTGAATGTVLTAADGTTTAVNLVDGNARTSGVSYDAADGDASWQAAGATVITFRDGGADIAGSGATLTGGIVTLSLPGTYVLEGSASDAQLIVYTELDDAVRLVLNGVTLSNADTSPIQVRKGKKLVMTLADGTENLLSDGVAGQEATLGDDDPDAVIWSKGDITLNGTGSLTVEANRKIGISSKDGLKIMSGSIHVTAVSDGIRARDYVAVAGGDVTVESGADGIQASNDEAADKGFVAIEGGRIRITAQKDGIQAETDILLLAGDIAIVSGGGSANGEVHQQTDMRGGSNGQTTTSTAATSDTSDSMKGLKAADGILVAGGTLAVDAADDAIHSDNVVRIEGGSLTLAAGDDALHGGSAVTVEDGAIDITTSYEAVESLVITINGGQIDMVSTDDGFNCAGGVDNSSGMQGMFAVTEGAMLTINGGTIHLNAGGDGLDSNGSISMTGGTVVVYGPTANNNGSIDYNGTFQLTGGSLLAVGSAGMAEAPDATSTQNILSIVLNQTQTAGTLVRIVNASGETVLAAVPEKDYQSVVFSSAALKTGETYAVCTGGTATGTVVDGVYSDGAYSGGTEQASVTVSSVLTTSGTAGGMGGGMAGMKGGMGGGTRPARNR